MRIGVAGVGRIGAFHAATLNGLAEVDSLLLADPVPGRAEQVAGDLGVEHLSTVAELMDSRIDALVITAASSAHAELLRAGIAAGLPIFCEKPVAATLDETLELTELEQRATAPIQIGFQRRFDAGYLKARESVSGGELGVLHSIRVNTHDASPPPADYIPTSGGLFRDCSVHDFDILRFVTGCEVRRVQAVGANRGADFFAAAGDVATAAALLTLDDDTLVVATAARYNGGGHDVRMELHGSEGALAVGLDDSLAFRSAEQGVGFPAGPQTWSFMERFEPAYRAELTTFCSVVAGRLPSPCTIADALQAFRIAEACDRARLAGGSVELAAIPDCQSQPD